MFFHDVDCRHFFGRGIKIADKKGTFLINLILFLTLNKKTYLIFEVIFFLSRDLLKMMIYYRKPQPQYFFIDNYLFIIIAFNHLYLK